MFDFLLEERCMCTKIVVQFMLRFTTARYNVSYYKKCDINLFYCVKFIAVPKAQV